MNRLYWVPKHLSVGINISEGLWSWSRFCFSQLCIGKPMKCTVYTSTCYMKADYFIWRSLLPSLTVPASILVRADVPTVGIKVFSQLLFICKVIQLTLYSLVFCFLLLYVRWVDFLLWTGTGTFAEELVGNLELLLVLQRSWVSSLMNRCSMYLICW